VAGVKTKNSAAATVAGQRVATMTPGQLSAGPHDVTWQVDRQTPGGVYFFKVFTNGVEAKGKMVRLD